MSRNVSVRVINQTEETITNLPVENSPEYLALLSKYGYANQEYIRPDESKSDDNLTFEELIAKYNKPVNATPPKPTVMPVSFNPKDVTYSRNSYDSMDDIGYNFNIQIVTNMKF